MDDLDIRLLVDLLRDRITPDKGLGQHFLIDESVVDRSIELANSSLPLSDSKIILYRPLRSMRRQYLILLGCSMEQMAD